MRNAFGVIIVLLTCLLILPCSKNVHGAEWKPYGRGENGTEYFYDVQSINYLPHNSVQVFVKMTPEDEEGRARAITEWRKRYPTFPDDLRTQHFYMKLIVKIEHLRFFNG